MIIQTLDKAYEVIKKFEENSERAVYLCRIPGDASGSSYLVTAFNSEQVPREHVIYFMELSVKQQTEDFEECFLKNGFLYLVFRHQEERKLRNELGEERLPVAERLAVSRSLMDRIVQKNLPDYLLYEALSSENVRVAGDSSVCFTYFLKETGQIGKELFPDICGRLAGWQESLFAREIDGHAAEPMAKFADSLRTGKYHSYAEIYRRYKAVYEKMRDQAAVDGLQPETFLIKLWKRLKKIGKWLRLLLYAAVLLALLGYLIFTFLAPAEGDTPVPFQQIGEVVIGTEEGTSAVGAKTTAEETTAAETTKRETTAGR